jgi:hypothetical protein
VASIRSRLGHVEAGRLSLAEHQAGALSLANETDPTEVHAVGDALAPRSDSAKGSRA